MRPRLSGSPLGPLLDRFDLRIEIEPVSFEELGKPLDAERSETVAVRVAAARRLQQRRFEKSGTVGSVNADLCGSLLEEHAAPRSAGADVDGGGGLTAFSLCARVSPYIEGRSHYRRSRAVRAGIAAPCCRGFGLSRACSQNSSLRECVFISRRTKSVTITYIDRLWRGYRTYAAGGGIAGDGEL